MFQRDKTNLQSELQRIRNNKALEVLYELQRRGVKKVGNTSIKEYLAENAEIDYDTIMGYY